MKKTGKLVKKQKKQKKDLSVYLFIIAVLLMLTSIIGFGGLYLVSSFYYDKYTSLAPISYEQLSPTQYVTYIYDYKGDYLARLHGEENREFAPLEAMPEHLKNAVIAMEDRRFYHHNGIDIRSIFRALYVNLQAQALLEGASTITQQLIKNNVLRDNRVDFNRKIEEQMIAVKLENDLAHKLGSKVRAKNYILEQYLNSVHLAHGIHGVRLGARYYFGKELEDLTLLECASIAAIIKNPVRFSPENAPEANRERAKTVLRIMLEEGLINLSEYQEAINDEFVVVLDAVDRSSVIHSYFTDAVINEVARDIMFEKGFDRVTAYRMVYSGGLRIYTTFDPEVQHIIDDAFNDSSLFPGRGVMTNVDITFYTLQGVVRKSAQLANNRVDAYIDEQRQSLKNAGYFIEDEFIQKIIQPQGAFAIIDFRTGHVPAIGAGRGEKQLNMAFNRATHSKRQPGSVFKVVAAYLPALDTGMLSANSLVEDAPFRVGNYSPQNYDFRYRGRIPVRTAIRDSINVAAVRTLVGVGYETSFAYLENLGFTTLVRERRTNGGFYTDLGPAMALGGLTDGVTPLETAAAFGAIANDGLYMKPVFYTKVLAHDGSVFLENNRPGRQVMKVETARALTDMMQDVVRSGTGTQARFRNLNLPIAGKTGTSTGDRDLTFAGYTPYYVAAVWEGYDVPRRLQYSTNYHLLLWRTIMERVHIQKGLTSGAFIRPENVFTAPAPGTSQGSAQPRPAPPAEDIPDAVADPEENDYDIPDAVIGDDINGYDDNIGWDFENNWDTADNTEEQSAEISAPPEPEQIQETPPAPEPALPALPALPDESAGVAE
jgi:penicillin-binding protein 1A